MNSFTDLPAWEKSTLLNTEAGLIHTRFSLSSSFPFRPRLLAGTALKDFMSAIVPLASLQVKQFLLSKSDLNVCVSDGNNEAV